MHRKIRKGQIQGNIVGSVTGSMVDNTDPENPIINTPDLDGYVTEEELDARGYLTEETDPKGVASFSFSGSTNKTLTIVLNDGTQLSSSFTDMDTLYQAITSGDLAAGTDLTNKLISAKIMVDYINSRLSSTMQYKGSKPNYSDLPPTGNNVGDVWNITNAFTHGGEDYPKGSNVAWNGADWDVLAGFIDTSAFLTVEVDPTGVNAITVTGTTTKTITVTLNNGTTKTAQFTDLNDNTTYSAGTLALLNAGVETTAMVWSPKILKDFVMGQGFITKQIVGTSLMYSLVAGQVVGSSMTLNLGTLVPYSDNKGMLIWINGVKIPHVAVSVNGSVVSVLISDMATPPSVGDDVEIWFEVAV